MTTACAIYKALEARENCVKAGNREWADKWAEELDAIAAALPSGGGFDNGSSIPSGLLRKHAFTIHTAFHHMNGGYYDGWTEHDVIVTPAFDGFDLRITGTNRDGIKEYIADVFNAALSAPRPWTFAAQEVK